MTSIGSISFVLVSLLNTLTNLILDSMKLIGFLSISTQFRLSDSAPNAAEPKIGTDVKIDNLKFQNLKILNSQQRSEISEPVYSYHSHN